MQKTYKNALGTNRLDMKFGLIGHPIGHSLSPALFKAGYDGRYPYHLIETEDFEEAYRRFINEYDGINVTAPFKELAYAKADILSEECRLTGATNLLIKTPEGVKAYNSDFLGVRMWLQNLPLARKDGESLLRSIPQSGISEGDKTDNVIVLIAGCGGAGKAAAAAAVTLGMHCIIMNRNRTKAEALSERLTSNGYQTEVRDIKDFKECFRKADIVIYNIPTAISQLTELTDEDFTPGKAKHILEANYKDPSFHKELIMRMREANPQAAYTEGRTWLLNQAVTGYEIFTGEKPDLAHMTAVI